MIDTGRSSRAGSLTFDLEPGREFLKRTTVCPRCALSRLRATAVVKIEAIAEPGAWQVS